MRESRLCQCFAAQPRLRWACSGVRSSQIRAMTDKTRSEDRRHGGGMRLYMLVLGPTLIVLSPVVGLIPGPGGLVVLVIGLGLTLKHSRLAKRYYVRIKRRWPRLGHWSDKGLKRPSHFRRLRRKQQ